MDVLSYTALGSGSYAAMGVLESAIHNNTSSNGRSIANDGYTPHNLTIDEAIALVVKAVKAGIDHDLGSGSQVDLCIITSDGIANYTRCYVPEEKYDNSDYSTTTMNTEHSSASKRNSRKSRSYQTIGINGFGNVPYIVRSKRALQQPGDNKALVEGWNDILPK
jgi:Proteasome subunit